MYLNTSILVEYLVRRITSGRYKLLNSYRKIIRRIKFAKIDKLIKVDKSKDKSKDNLINMTLLNNISNICAPFWIFRACLRARRT